MTSEVDRRSAGSERGERRLVADALTYCFAAQDRRALARVYPEATRDLEFQAGKEAVHEDFARPHRKAAAAGL